MYQQLFAHAKRLLMTASLLSAVGLLLSLPTAVKAQDTPESTPSTEPVPEATPAVATPEPTPAPEPGIGEEPDAGSGTLVEDTQLETEAAADSEEGAVGVEAEAPAEAGTPAAVPAATPVVAPAAAPPAAAPTATPATATPTANPAAPAAPATGNRNSSPRALW